MSPSGAPVPSESEPFDRARLLAAVEGSFEFLQQMLRIVAEHDGPRLLDELRRAADHADPMALTEAAHGLKGIAAELAADPTYELAQRLESLGAKGDIETALPLATELEAEFGALVEALTAFVDESFQHSSAPEAHEDGSHD